MTEQSEQLPQPGDGVAREDQNGTWSVCRVMPDHRLEPVEGPFDEATATERLRELFPVSKADQWVMNRFGIVRTLN